MLRVLPGYWFALTVCVVLLGQLLGGAKNAFLYYFLLFPFASTDVALGGGPGQEGDYAIPQAWSLTAEFIFYLMLPVIAILMVRLGREEGAAGAGAQRAASSARRSTSSARASASTSSPRTRRGSASPPSGRPTGSTSSPSAWRWPRSACGSTAAGGCRRLLVYLGDHPVVSWVIAAVVVLSSATFRAPTTPG